MNNVKIEVGPRIHLGLISMHANAVRKNGGIGFSIAGPTAIIDIRVAEQLCVRDERRCPFTLAEIDQLRTSITQPLGADGPVLRAHINVSGAMRTHVGMGSGTAIRLAIIEGLQLLYGLRPTQQKLIERSGRGGTSGIGVTTYFFGGMVFDLGTTNDGSPFIPSSRLMMGRKPSALPALSMPNWPLCICVPRSIRPKTQDEEAEFFARTAPLSQTASYRASYEALFGVYASVLEANYSAFCRGVEAMQEIDWKACEWHEYGQPLKDLKRDLARHGADCVGMSSLGPMLFCFGSPSTLEAISYEQDALDCDVFQTVPHNHGRAISRGMRCEN